MTEIAIAAAAAITGLAALGFFWALDWVIEALARNKRE